MCLVNHVCNRVAFIKGMQTLKNRRSEDHLVHEYLVVLLILNKSLSCT